MKNTPIHNPIYQNHVEQYGSYLQTMGYATKTVTGSQWLVLEFLAYLETNLIDKIEAIQRTDIESFMESLATRPSQRKDSVNGLLSLAHRSKYWQAIANFDKYLRHTEQGKLTMPLHRNLPQTRKKIEVLSEQEIRTLYESCDLSHPLGIRDRAILALFYGCGLRRKEGMSLEVKDIKLDHKLIHVRAGKGRKERYVPMSKAVRSDLNLYLYQGRPFLQNAAQLNADKEVVGRHSVTALLLSEKGTQANSETIAKRLQRMPQNTDDETLKNKRITLHLLRHSIATHLLEKGMNIKRIAQFLGHSQLESTQYYTHYTHGKL
jgi:integrase/recombinase XerD